MSQSMITFQTQNFGTGCGCQQNWGFEQDWNFGCGRTMGCGCGANFGCGCGMNCGCGCGCGCGGGCAGRMVTLSGTVRDSLGGPVSGLTIQYTVDGVSHTTTTDANGRYTISAPRDAVVVITPQPGLGVTVMPTSRTVAACQSQANLDFTLSPLTPANFTVSGMLTGLVGMANLPVQYTVNGQARLAFTDTLGGYSLTAPAGANIVITPPAVTGYTAAPMSLTLSNLASNMTNQNFNYTLV